MRELFLICIATISFFKAAAQPEKAEAGIREIMKRLDVVGISIVVIKKNKPVYTRAFGLKNIEKQIPLSSSDLFRIASISKSFSATTMMRLAEAGKVSLDSDFGNLIGFAIRNPKYPEKVITLRMVMSHTSGINDSEGYFNLDVINPSKNPDWAKCYNAYAPGEGYQYCNLNFNMVGAVLEKISGVRFDSYIRQQVLNPLGLYGGYCVDSLNNEMLTTLYEYDSATKRFTAADSAYATRRKELATYIMGYTTPVFSPTGGMKISAIDLAKYMTMHMNFGKNKTGKGGRIISRKSSKTMQTPLSDTENYGLALWKTDQVVPGVMLTGHTGSAYGLYSAMFFDPKKKYGFVVITNGCNPIYTNGTNEVLRSSINVLYDAFIK